MATALNLPLPPLLRPLSLRKTPRTRVSVRATSSSSDSGPSVSTKEEQKQDLSPSSSSSSSLTFAAPPGFKPPEPKRFGVRPDKTWDIFGASLALFFRLGTGVFASGYSVSFIPKNEFPPGQYALDVNDFKVKETSKLGPRPEKPIEIYEFESCPFCRKVREIVVDNQIKILSPTTEIHN